MERTLRGGPLDGEVRDWMEGTEYEAAHYCPDEAAAPLALDTSRYDRDGNYLWSQHGSDVKYEPCGKCSLCPGHLVESTPGERYQWDPTASEVW